MNKNEKRFEKAKELYEISNANQRCVLESLFPELKESEDEKIRKELIKFVKVNIPDEERYIAWLEKQGDKDKLIQELGEYKVKYTQEVLEKHLKTINKDDERLRKTTIAFLKDFAEQGYENAVECIDWLEKHEQKPVISDDAIREGIAHFGITQYQIDNWLKKYVDVEKQGEKPQGKSALEAIKEEKVDNANKIEPKDYSSIDPHFGKPIDKVEPKFNEGDWIIKDYHICKITGIKDGNYTIESTYGYKGHNQFDVFDNAYRLWTIQDAKDGDVLATLAGAFIYNGNKGGSSCPGSYCGINTLGRFQTGVETHWTGKKVYPATKKQRDLLFQKMREAGYEWSADKKELRKIEQNSDNKVEPMFHEGDWVVYNNDICQIVKREEGCNKLVTVFGIEKELVNERNLSTARLWTLADAKAGDILACNKEILLFKSYSVQGRISLYCWYNGQTNNFHSKGVDDALVTTRNKIWPATKEQSDILKKVMGDEGYTFDFENMELRKIEQNNTDEYIETKGLFEIEAEAEELAKKQFDEQKPAWSEEDDRMMNDTLAMVDWYAGKHKNISVKVGNWLKSLKERVQPQPKSAWSEEDMAMLDSTIAFVEHSAFTTIGKGKNNVIDWLKSLKDQVQPKFSEWREEDENRINRLIAYFEDKESFTAKDDVAYANWLKSIKNHISNEKKEALKDAVDAEIIEVEDDNCSMCAYTHLEISTDEDLSKICKAGDKAKVIIVK